MESKKIFISFFRNRKIKLREKKNKQIFNMKCDRYVWKTRLKKNQIKTILERWNQIFGNNEEIDFSNYLISIRKNKDFQKEENKWIRKVPIQAWKFLFKILHRDYKIYEEDVVLFVSYILKNYDEKYKNLFLLMKTEKQKEKITSDELFIFKKMIRDYCWDIRVEKPQKKPTDKQIKKMIKRICPTSSLSLEQFKIMVKTNEEFYEEFIRPLVYLAQIFLPIKYVNKI